MLTSTVYDLIEIIFKKVHYLVISYFILCFVLTVVIPQKQSKKRGRYKLINCLFAYEKDPSTKKPQTFVLFFFFFLTVGSVCFYVQALMATQTILLLNSFEVVRGTNHSIHHFCL